MSDEHIHWQPEPSLRGTFGIVITCFATLGICVWSALHLSIPKKRHSHKKNVFIKLFWAGVGFFLPEMLVLAALCQRLSAQQVSGKVNKLLGLPTREREWYRGLVKWFASIGAKKPAIQVEEEKDLSRAGLLSFDPEHDGDVERGSGERPSAERPSVEILPGERPSIERASIQGLSVEANESLVSITLQDTQGRRFYPGAEVIRKHQWTLVHGFYAVMGGFAYEEMDMSGNTIRRVISPDGIIELAERRPELIPDISEQQIYDKGKSDGLAKTLLVIQVAWFFFNVIGRLGQHLPLTLLEISTVSYTFCTLFLYALWWHKPLNIIEPTIIPHPRNKIDTRGAGSIEFAMSAKVKESDVHVWMAVCLVFSFLYGAPHFGAWNSDFATHAEKLLWRLCAGFVTGTPMLLFGLSWFFVVTGIYEDITMDYSTWILLVVCPFMYYPAKLYLMAASLRQLFNLTPAAYSLPVWTDYIPHFS